MGRCVGLLKDQLDHNNTTLVIAALGALGEAGRYGMLPGDGVKEVLEKMFYICKNGKENKLQEAGVTALSHIALGSMRYGFDELMSSGGSDAMNDDKSIRQQVIDFFFTLSPMFGKAIEVQFTIGEAITVCAAGWSALPMSKYMDIADVGKGLVEKCAGRTGIYLTGT